MCEVSYGISMKSLVWDWQLHLSNVKSRIFSHFSRWSLKDHCGSEPQENTGTRSGRMFQLRFPKLHVHVAAFENQLLLIVISILQLSFLIPKNPPARIVAFAYIILHVVAFFIVPRMAEGLFTAGISTENIRMPRKRGWVRLGYRKHMPVISSETTHCVVA